jgi:hypothetical protein
LIEDDAGEVMEGDVDGVIFCGVDASGWVDQLGNGFSFNEFEELFGFAGFPLSLAPTGRALVGVKDTNSQLGGTMTVNAFAGIAADLARPGDADGPEFDPVNTMFGKRRVGGVREPRQRCGCSSDGSATQEGAAVYGALDHGALDHGALDHGALEHGALEHGAAAHLAPDDLRESR